MIKESEIVYLKLQKSQYAKQKTFIKKCFQVDLAKRRDNLLLRLQIIDALYSTQMNKRYFGLEDIVEELVKYSDRELKNDALKVVLGGYSTIVNDLFSIRYGYDKNGKKSRKAVSLLSKYLYFLTNYHFPIYDSLIRIAYPKFVSQYNLELKYQKISDKNFVEALSDLNNKETVRILNHFDKNVPHWFLSPWFPNKSKKDVYDASQDFERKQSMV